MVYCNTLGCCVLSVISNLRPSQEVVVKYDIVLSEVQRKEKKSLYLAKRAELAVITKVGSMPFTTFIQMILETMVETMVVGLWLVEEDLS